MIESLRRVIRLAPEALATSHRGLILEPAPALREQLDYLETLAGRIAHFRGAGLSIDAIVRELFGGEPTPPGTDITWQQLSRGEFSSRRWIKAFLRPGATEDAAGHSRV